MIRLSEIFKLIRIQQWHKNAFVLLGFFLMGEYGMYSLLVKSMVMFAAFCFASSAVYIFNDFRDVESDKMHPIKKERPLARGSIKTGTALILSFIFCLLSIILSYSISILGLAIILVYILNNIAYSLSLKKVPIIDVFQIGFGFMLRIFAGTVGVGIYISEWMILTGFMISLLIGFAKRYAELTCTESSHDHRKVLQEYSEDILRSFMIIMASATVITYSLYTLSPRSVELHGTTDLVYTIPFVIYGIFRFLYLVMVHKTGDDPSSQIFKDRHILVTVFLWAVIYGLIIS